MATASPWFFYIFYLKAEENYFASISRVLLAIPPKTCGRLVVLSVCRYLYRLCKADAALTEECFQQVPVPFGGKTWLEWANGTRYPVESRYLTSPGNVPPMSTWAMQPLPYSDRNHEVQFEPPCPETVDRLKNDTGLCSGRFPWDVAIVDTLVVPRGLVPGEYVLGFRWDCEATAQVWQSCADIEIVA